MAYARRNISRVNRRPTYRYNRRTPALRMRQPVRNGRTAGYARRR